MITIEDIKNKVISDLNKVAETTRNNAENLLGSDEPSLKKSIYMKSQLEMYMNTVKKGYPELKKSLINTYGYINITEGDYYFMIQEINNEILPSINIDFRQKRQKPEIVELVKGLISSFKEFIRITSKYPTQLSEIEVKEKLVKDCQMLKDEYNEGYSDLDLEDDLYGNSISERLSKVEYCYLVDQLSIKIFNEIYNISYKKPEDDIFNLNQYL